MRKLLAASAAAAAMLALTACAGADGQAAAPAPTVTVTTTVTAPAPTPTPTPTVEETTPTPTPTPTATATSRFILTCDVDLTAEDDFASSFSQSEEMRYDTLADAWADDRMKRFCEAEYVGGEPFKPSKAEAQAIKVGKFGDGEQQTLEIVGNGLATCVEFQTDEDGDATEEVPRPWLKAALLLCPKAPHASEMRLWAEGRKFYDGEYEVGTEIAPGTYRTQGPVSDCYWERTTSGGNTIANDFVTHAPQGVRVRIRASDGGFVSRECGLWTEVK